MEGSFSPILRKIAAEVVSKPKRSSNLLTEICLEDWWLTRPESGEGIAVSGRPVEIRKFDDALEKFKTPPPKRARAFREFHSAQIVKRHGCTTLEGSDGSLISLCGFINKSRTQENGFSFEVCRDFIYGFPFNWSDYAAQSPVKEVESESEDVSVEGFIPAAEDLRNGAQLHDLVQSLTDTLKGQFGQNCCNDLLKMLDPHAEGAVVLALCSDPPSLREADASDLTPASKKQQKVPYPDRLDSFIA